MLSRSKKILKIRGRGNRGNREKSHFGNSEIAPAIVGSDYRLGSLRSAGPIVALGVVMGVADAMHRNMRFPMLNYLSIYTEHTIV